VGIATGIPHGANLVVQAPPVLSQHVRASDHDIDLFSAGSNRCADLAEPLLEWG
jgi:hypothetical protein